MLAKENATQRSALAYTLSEVTEYTVSKSYWVKTQKVFLCP